MTKTTLQGGPGWGFFGAHRHPAPPSLATPSHRDGRQPFSHARAQRRSIASVRCTRATKSDLFRGPCNCSARCHDLRGCKLRSWTLWLGRHCIACAPHGRLRKGISPWGDVCGATRAYTLDPRRRVGYLTPVLSTRGSSVTPLFARHVECRYALVARTHSARRRAGNTNGPPFVRVGLRRAAAALPPPAVGA